MKFKKPIKADILYLNNSSIIKDIRIEEADITDHIKIENKYFLITSLNRNQIKLMEFIPSNTPSSFKEASYVSINN